MARTSEANGRPCLYSNAQSQNETHFKIERTQSGNTERDTRLEAPSLAKEVVWWSGPELQAQNKRRAKALRRSRPRTIKEAMKLQKRLNTCTEGEPCDSAACVPCSYRLRLPFIHAGTYFFGADHGNLIPVAITIIPANERVSYRRMDAWSLNGFVRRMKARLNAISPELLVCAAGAVDISLNRDKRKRPKHQRYRVHIMPHLHLAGLTPDPTRLARELRALFPADPVHAKRPERVQELTPDEYPMSYFMRLEFDRRTHKTDETGKDIVRKDPLRTGKKDPVTGKSYTELQRVLIAIGKNSLADRGFFFRCRLILDGPMAPAITLIQSPPHTSSRKRTRLRADRVYPTRRVKR